ncbi:MAG: hypothetical protein RRA92_02390 [Gemmatimonadota bacterium]|nr:hypothetical protein [Gemmatimonadota bacterium]
MDRQSRSPAAARPIARAAGLRVLAGAGLLLLAAPGPGEVTAQEQAPLPDGPYASRQVVTSRTSPGPRARPIPVRTIGLVLHEVRRADGEIHVSTRYCALRQDPIGRVRTVLDSAYVAALPAWEARVEVESRAEAESGPAEEASAGQWTVRVAEHAAVVGARLDDPGFDPLPAEADDPRVTDPDEDGEPGVTVRVEGFVSGEVYLVQRLVRGLEGTLDAAGRMRGRVTGRTEQRTIGASNLLLRAFTPTFEPDPDPARNTFDWAPLTPGEGCGTVVAAEDRLFGPLD